MTMIPPGYPADTETDDAITGFQIADPSDVNHPVYLPINGQGALFVDANGHPFYWTAFGFLVSTPTLPVVAIGHTVPAPWNDVAPVTPAPEPTPTPEPAIVAPVVPETPPVEPVVPASIPPVPSQVKVEAVGGSRGWLVHVEHAGVVLFHEIVTDAATAGRHLTEWLRTH